MQPSSEANGGITGELVALLAGCGQALQQLETAQCPALYVAIGSDLSILSLCRAKRVERRPQCGSRRLKGGRGHRHLGDDRGDVCQLLELFINRESGGSLLRYLLRVPIWLRRRFVSSLCRHRVLVLVLVLRVIFLALRSVDQEIEVKVEQVHMLPELGRVNLRIAGQLPNNNNTVSIGRAHNGNTGLSAKAEGEPKSRPSGRQIRTRRRSRCSRASGGSCAPPRDREAGPAVLNARCRKEQPMSAGPAGVKVERR